MATNRLIHGDMLEVLPREIPDASIHMICTDPPYGVSFRSNMGEEGFQKEAIANDGYKNWQENLPRWVKAMRRVLAPGGCLAMFCGVQGADKGRRIMPLAYAVNVVETYFGEVAHTLVWDRLDMGMGWSYRPQWEAILVAYHGDKPRVWHGNGTQSNVLRRPRIIPKAGEHPTPKPVPLLADLIELNTDPGDLVLDPFCGGGPTLEAAELLKRKWIGIDIEQRYVDMSILRMSAHRDQPVMF